MTSRGFVDAINADHLAIRMHEIELGRIAAEYRRTHKDCQSAEQFHDPGTYVDTRCATCKAYDALTQKD